MIACRYTLDRLSLSSDVGQALSSVLELPPVLRTVTVWCSERGVGLIRPR